MRMISIRQPWLNRIMYEGKDVENRSGSIGRTVQVRPSSLISHLSSLAWRIAWKAGGVEVCVRVADIPELTYPCHLPSTHRLGNQRTTTRTFLPTSNLRAGIPSTARGRTPRKPHSGPPTATALRFRGLCSGTETRASNSNKSHVLGCVRLRRPYRRRASSSHHRGLTWL